MTPQERSIAERYRPSADLQQELQEQGRPAPMPPPVTGQMPGNNGLWSVPQYQQFAAVYNWASRTYHWTYDAAIKDSRLNALVMRDDYIIKPALRHRAIPVIQSDWQLEPIDPMNQALVDNAFKLTKNLERIPRFQQMKRSIMDYQFFGRSAIQMKSDWDYSTGDKRLIISDWNSIHPDSIVFKYDGDSGILVNSAAFDGTVEYTARGPAHFFTPAEREFILIGEFEPESVDFYQADMAGAVHGLGYRGTLYWVWWLREKLTSILMDFMEKVGTGITIFFYEAGNAKSKIEVENAARSQVGNNVFLFPRNRDGESAYAGPGIQRVEVSMTGAKMFTDLWNMLNAIMRFSIMGESATSEDVSAGLGSSIGDQHGITADQRVKYDCQDLEWPMQQLVNTLNRWNYPGSPAPRFKFMVDKRNPGEFMEAFQVAYEAGLEVSENQVRDELSFPAPQPGEKVLSKIQQMQPSAVGQIPQGVPIAAPTGPEQAPDGQSPDGSPNGGVQGIPIQSSALVQQPQQGG